MPGNIKDIPLEVFQTWPPPNYDDPVRRAWMPIYAGILQGVMTIMLVLRLWLRFQNRAGALGLDDLLLIPAFLAGTAFTVMVIMCCILWGTDRHTWDVPVQDFENSLLYGAFASEIAFLISTCCTKVSILLFYRRLTEGTYNKKWVWATIAAIVFTIVFCLAFIFVLVFQCRPTAAYWKSLSLTYTEDYQCTDTRVLNPISGALSVLSDFYSVLLPMAMTRHFDIDRRKKIALNAVFSLGLLVVAAGAARTYYLTRLGNDYDITWLGFDVFIWAELEMNLAIMCACAPALRVLFRRYFKDPISRAINSANSRSRSRSGLRSLQRDSKHLDTATTGDAMDLKGTGDKSLIDDHSQQKHSVVTDEREVDSFSSTTAPSESHNIKTPADYETYALQSLHRARAESFSRGPPPRFKDEYDVHPPPQNQTRLYHDQPLDGRGYNLDPRSQWQQHPTPQTQEYRPYSQRQQHPTSQTWDDRPYTQPLPQTWDDRSYNPRQPQHHPTPQIHGHRPYDQRHPSPSTQTSYWDDRSHSPYRERERGNGTYTNWSRPGGGAGGGGGTFLDTDSG